jgi:hypothetical protein
VTRERAEVDWVLALAATGVNSCEISRRTGIPRSTIVAWRLGRVPGGPGRRPDRGTAACLRCSGYREHPFPVLTDYAYAYLLGMYLGDGCLLRAARKGVYRLNISLDAAYPIICEEAQAAATIVVPASKASIRRHPRHRLRWVDSYSKHWPCLFPQHGPGLKHKRPIVLDPWQREIVDRYPWRFLRGLIHSDGCRHINTIKHPNKIYRYPRYAFSNRSDDIRALFCEYCDKVGVEWRGMNRWNISVARRGSVALMDRHIGPKR